MHAGFGCMRRWKTAGYGDWKMISDACLESLHSLPYSDVSSAQCRPRRRLSLPIPFQLVRGGIEGK
jgi:hypothetical protein